MQDATRGHRYVVITSDQLERLHRLADAANTLFKRLQVISVPDLVYAAIWRQISAVRSGEKALTLTVIEAGGEEALSDGNVQNIPYATLSSTIDCLSSLPLVGVAQRIRCRLEEGGGDTDYEGWLVDSLTSTGREADPQGQGGLICSSLPPACLQELLQYRASGFSRRDRKRVRVTVDTEVPKNLPARRACLGLDDYSEVAIDTSPWICCINFGGKHCGGGGLAGKRPAGRDSGKGSLAGGYLPSGSILGSNYAEDGAGSWGRKSSPGNNSNKEDISPGAGEANDLSHDLISIDMWGPLMEVDRFDVLYGDCCFVGDDFFEN